MHLFHFHFNIFKQSHYKTFFPSLLFSRVIAEDDTGGGSGVELVSPDSGMTTIRSSRSSKASSVFLSDDSPVGDVTVGGATAGLLARNQSSVVSSSHSILVPPERMTHRHNRHKSDSFDSLHLDPLQGSDNSVPSRGGGKRAESSSFSELEELNLVNFSGSKLERKTSSTEHQNEIHRNDMMDTMVPLTPVNSVAGSRPTSSCCIRFFPEDVVERINSLQNKDSMSSSLSETWDELDTQGASTSSDSAAWNRTMGTESPLAMMEEASGKELTERRIEEESFHSRWRSQTLEPQLSLIIEPAEFSDSWNTDSLVNDQWNPVREKETGKSRAGITGGKEKTSSLLKKKAVPHTLTPDMSKEEDEGTQGIKGDRQMELLDFWTYSAQKGFLKSDSGTTTSYPESLDMWNMTIRDDSLSPLTTPDNISETSRSFCRLSPTTGAEGTGESPLGFTDSGMAMWNTTIQEDSSSAVTTPEASENGYLIDVQARASPEELKNKVMEGNTAKEEDRDTEPGYSLKIVIESVEDKTQIDDVDDDDYDGDSPHIHDQNAHSRRLASKLPQEFCGTDMSIPVPGMVTSTSEYDNVGVSSWSLTSSPEAYASPVIDIIHVEEQYSPFVAVSRPHQINEGHHQDQQNGYVEKTTYAAGQHRESQVFRFERTSDTDNPSRGSSASGKYDNKRGERTEEEADWNKQARNHSPFLLVDVSVISQDTSADRDFQIAISPQENASILNLQGRPTSRSTEDVTGIETEALSLNCSLFEPEQDRLRHSYDSLHPGSQDDLRSSFDGDSSGLEMEYIIMSGTVKEAERECCKRHKQSHSRVSCAAIGLQDQDQAVQRDPENLGGSTSEHPTTEMIINNQPKSHLIQPRVENGSHDGNSDSLSCSLSPSLRYPSDHFLKAREEVFVHSQISMEDSDEGGQSPSAPLLCSTSLGNMQTWKGQLTRKDTPEASSEPQSPIFTHSSLSHTSSFGTPLSESGISTDRGLGLPFSGDLMEEENNEVEHEENIASAHNILAQRTAGPQSEMEEQQQARSPQLLGFAERLSGASPLPQRDKFQQNAAGHCNWQLVSFVHLRKQWSTKQQISDRKACHVTNPFDSR